MLVAIGANFNGDRIGKGQGATVESLIGAPPAMLAFTGDRFNSIIRENTGHAYLPEMKAEMAAWFDRWLR